MKKKLMLSGLIITLFGGVLLFSAVGGNSIINADSVSDPSLQIMNIMMWAGLAVIAVGALLFGYASYSERR
jgi:hypothetical protein